MWGTYHGTHPFPTKTQIMTYRILSTVFASREARVVRVPLTEGRRSHKKNDSPEKPGGASGADEYSSLAPQYGAGGSVPSSPEGPGAPLVSTLEFVESSDTKDSFSRVYSRKARETLRRIGIAAEDLHPEAQEWVFYTLTYPTESPEGQRAIALNSGHTVKSLLDWIRYKYSLEAFFYVWERQKRGTLHLHLCAHIPTDDTEFSLNEDFKHWAIAHVSRLSNKTGVNLWLNKWGCDHSSNPDVLRTDAQRVRKSVARYLAKYVSKSASKKTVDWAVKKYPSPRRWWGSSTNLKDHVKTLTTEVREDYSGYIAGCNRFEELVSKLRLFHPNSTTYYNRLSNCDGESFSLFKVEPCARLKLFPMQLRGKSIMGYSTSQNLNLALNSCLRWMESRGALEQVLVDCPVSLKKHKLLMTYWEQLAEIARLDSCSVQQATSLLTQMNAQREDFQRQYLELSWSLKSRERWTLRLGFLRLLMAQQELYLALKEVRAPLVKRLAT
jgi:hypothetical protein